MSTVQKFTVVVLRLAAVWIGVRGILGAVGLAGMRGMVRAEGGMMGAMARYGMAATLVTILVGVVLFLAAGPIARLLTFDLE